MTIRSGDGVLLVAHGTVAKSEDIPAFLGRIRGGRPVPPGLSEETRRRYELIGGSPLLSVTEKQAACLSERLGAPVLVGMRLWDPSIEAALARAGELGLDRLAVLPLAPYSVQVYFRAAEQARANESSAGRRVPEVVSVGEWGTHPALIDAHVAQISPQIGAGDQLILTAHSLPLVALRSGDRYETEVRASAEAVGKRLGVPFDLAFQSQGADGGEWLGPTLRASLERARAGGSRRVVIAPFGFLCDHVETLYDLDHEARGWADELGLEFVRVPALGTAKGLIDAMEDLARRSLT